MSWLKRNAETIEAGAAVVTALVAVAALIGVKLQIDASHALTQAQGARDLYREHLALSLQHPQFADPGNCPVYSETDETAYISYVTHLVYTAEETILADPEWRPVMQAALEPHARFICDSLDTGFALTDPVARMLGEIALEKCETLEPCF